jgi:hypothetical protein
MAELCIRDPGIKNTISRFHISCSGLPVFLDTDGEKSGRILFMALPFIYMLVISAAYLYR